jgi:hypothetical protein
VAVSKNDNQMYFINYNSPSGIYHMNKNDGTGVSQLISANSSYIFTD